MNTLLAPCPSHPSSVQSPPDHADPLDWHRATTMAMLKAASELHRHDKKQQLIAERVAFTTGPMLDGRTPSLAFQLRRPERLERALSFGVRAAVFVPGADEFAGEMPNPIPAHWVRMPTVLEELGEGWFAIGQPKDLGRAIATPGMLVLEPSTGIIELGKKLRRLHNHPESVPLKLAPRALNWSEDDVAPPDLAVEVAGLNQEQVRAVQMFASNDVIFVWGPPGTGKSQTICEMLEYAVGQGWRVLVVSIANRAIDAVAEKILRQAERGTGNLAREVEAGRVTRYGTPTPGTRLGKINSRWKNGEQARMRDPADDAITICTIHRFLSTDLPPYDVVVVDEAGTVAAPYIYVALAWAKQKVVVVGDHCQNRPVMAYQGVSAATRRLFEQSIFERMEARRDGSDRRLNLLPVQYRMRERLAANVRLTGLYPRYETPEGDRPLPSAGQLAVALPPLPGKESVVVDTSRPAGQPGYYADNSNTYHLALIARLLDRYTQERGLGPVGVVVPYRNQVKLLTALKAERKWPHVLIGTVHTFQGSECELMIFDTVEGQPAPGKDKPRCRFTDDGHYHEARLVLNVALSRAGAKLVTLMDESYLRTQLTPEATLLRLYDEAKKRGEVVLAEAWAPGLMEDGCKEGGSEQATGGGQFSPLPMLVGPSDLEHYLVGDAGQARRTVDVFSPRVDVEFGARVIRRLVEALAPGVTLRLYGPRRLLQSARDVAGLTGEQAGAVILAPGSAWRGPGELTMDGSLHYVGVPALLAGELLPTIQRRL